MCPFFDDFHLNLAPQRLVTHGELRAVGIHRHGVIVGAVDVVLFNPGLGQRRQVVDRVDVP